MTQQPCCFRIIDCYTQTKNPNVSPEMTKFGLFVFGGRGWIRTTEVSDDRFTVCSLWPLGNSPILKWSWWTDSNPRPADYKSAALPTELHQRINNAQLIYHNDLHKSRHFLKIFKYFIIIRSSAQLLRICFEIYQPITARTNDKTARITKLRPFFSSFEPMYITTKPGAKRIFATMLSFEYCSFITIASSTRGKRLLSRETVSHTKSIGNRVSTSATAFASVIVEERACIEATKPL